MEFIHHIQAPACILDHHNHIILANASFISNFGDGEYPYPMESLLASGEYVKFSRFIKNAFKTNAPETGQIKLLNKDKFDSECEIQLMPLSNDNRMVVINQDFDAIFAKKAHTSLCILLNLINRIQVARNLNHEIKAGCSTLLHELLKLTASDYAFLAQTTSKRNTLVPLAIATRQSDNSSTQMHHKEIPKGIPHTSCHPFVQDIMNSSRVVLRNSVNEKIQTYPGQNQAMGDHHFLGFPILHRNQLVGVLLLASRKTPYQQQLPKLLYQNLYAISTFLKSSQLRVERDEKERLIGESQQRYALAIRGTDDGLWDWEIASETVYYSDRFKSLLGFEETEFGNCFSDWSERIHPDDKRKVLRAIDQHLTHTEPYDEEFRLRHKKGHYLWFHTRGQAVWDVSGAAVRMAGSLSDISKRKKAERRLKMLESVVVNTESGTLVTRVENCEPSITFCNLAFENITGISSESLIGQSPESFINNDNPLWKNLVQVIKAGTSIDTDCEFLSPLGIYATMHQHIYPMYDDDGELCFVTVIVRDISERVNYEQHLRRTQKMEAIDKLVGGIAHDFNNIIGIIKGNLELLEIKIPDSPKLTKNVSAALKAVGRAKDLTGKLQQFSREKPLGASSVCVGEAINDLKDLLLSSIPNSIDFTFAINSDNWCTSMDKGDFSDALVNLAVNARDAMEDQGKLTVSTYPVYLVNALEGISAPILSGEYIRILVKDTGPGISQDIIDKVFDPFFTTKGKAKGTGLGLSMVYGFVKRSKGYIRLDSELNQGACVNIWLPRCEAQQEAVIDTKARQPSYIGRGKTVLVVDDESDIANIIKSLLENRGFNVILSGNGDKALTLLNSRSDIQLLVSDVIMPGNTNGFQLAEKFIKTDKNNKVLLVSGFVETDATTPELADKFPLVAKPFASNDFYQALAKAFNLPI